MINLINCPKLVVSKPVLEDNKFQFGPCQAPPVRANPPEKTRPFFALACIFDRINGLWHKFVPFSECMDKIQKTEKLSKTLIYFPKMLYLPNIVYFFFARSELKAHTNSCKTMPHPLLHALGGARDGGGACGKE